MIPEMSHNGGKDMDKEKDELFTTCPICIEVLTLDDSTLINCGHVYHYDCIKQMYEHDRLNGKVSACTICRVKIVSKPNKLYGKFSKEPFMYKVPKESVQPNINGTRQKKAGVSEQELDDDEDDWDDEDGDNEELIEFYDGRLRDLERQVQELEPVRSENERLRSENAQLKRTVLEKINILKERSRELDDRNLRITTSLKRQKDLEEELLKVNLEHDEAKRELHSYKNVQIATEVERLTTTISRLQTDSYFKAMLNDPTMIKEKLIGMLAGMKAKVSGFEAEKMEMERELRHLKIYKENAEKRERKKKELELLNNRERENIDSVRINVMPPENIVDEKGTDESHPDPYMVTRTTTPATSKMVPTAAPKGFKVPKSMVANGTGKRMKVIDMPDGKRFFI